MRRTSAVPSASKESNTSPVNPPGLGVAPDLSGSGYPPDVVTVLGEQGPTAKSHWSFCCLNCSDSQVGIWHIVWSDLHHTNLPITGEPWKRPSATCRVWAESCSHCTECYIHCQGLSPVSFLNPHLPWVSKSRLSYFDLDKLELSFLGWGRRHAVSQMWQTVLDEWPPKTCIKNIDILLRLCDLYNFTFVLLGSALHEYNSSAMKNLHKHSQ